MKVYAAERGKEGVSKVRQVNVPQSCYKSRAGNKIMAAARGEDSSALKAEMEVTEEKPASNVDEKVDGGSNDDAAVKDAGGKAETADESPTKKRKASDGEGQETSDNDEEEKEGDGEKDGEDEAKKQKTMEPIQLGPKIFKKARSMYSYFHDLLVKYPPNQDLNEYEHQVVLDLLKKGHVDAAGKIGPGVRAFQIRVHPEHDSPCYFIIRTDGTKVDFSYRKGVIVARIFFVGVCWRPAAVRRGKQAGDTIELPADAILGGPGGASTDTQQS
eukprot:jgi/Mesvir1/16713/Mv15104-RA.1